MTKTQATKIITGYYQGRADKAAPGSPDKARYQELADAHAVIGGSEPAAPKAASSPKAAKKPATKKSAKPAAKPETSQG